MPLNTSSLLYFELSLRPALGPVQLKKLSRPKAETSLFAFDGTHKFPCGTDETRTMQARDPVIQLIGQGAEQHCNTVPTREREEPRQRDGEIGQVLFVHLSRVTDLAAGGASDASPRLAAGLSLPPWRRDDLPRVPLPRQARGWSSGVPLAQLGLV